MLNSTLPTDPLQLTAPNLAPNLTAHFETPQTMSIYEPSLLQSGSVGPVDVSLAQDPLHIYGSGLGEETYVEPAAASLALQFDNHNAQSATIPKPTPLINSEKQKDLSAILSPIRIVNANRKQRWFLSAVQARRKPKSLRSPLVGGVEMQRSKRIAIPMGDEGPRGTVEYLWSRARVWIEGTFAFSVMDRWEQVIFGERFPSFTVF